jgi:hypothetical protein
MSEPPLLVLDSARLSVDPGEEALLSLRVRNRSAVVDELKIEVLGAGAEWAEAEPAVLSLFPGADGQALIRFRPPRTSKLAAGALPVGVRVVSTVDGDRKAVEECQLQIGSFRDVTAELWPKSSRGLRRGRHELRLRNDGNVPAGVSAEPADLDGSCRVAVQPSRLVVAPGQVANARVTVRPSRMLWFGAVETYSFAVRAEPEPGRELKVPGSMRQGPLVPGSAATLALAVVAAVAAGALLLAGRGPTLLRAVASPTSTPEAANAALAVAPSGPAASPGASPSSSPPSSSLSPSPSPSRSAPGSAPTGSPIAGGPSPSPTTVAGTVTPTPAPPTPAAPPAVPNVVDEFTTTATADIRAAGLVPSVASQNDPACNFINQVIRQSPGGGTVVQSGSTVNIWIGTHSGPCP